MQRNRRQGSHKKGSHKKGFTLIELLVVISIIALLIGILLPALGAARRTARKLTNSTNLRSIHQAMFVFAQSNKTGGGDGYFPGLNNRGNEIEDVTTGTPADPGPEVAITDTYDSDGDGAFDDVTMRMAILADTGAITPDLLINPADPVVSEPEGDTAPYTIEPENVSYAFLDLSDVGTAEAPARRGEWKDTASTAAIVGVDRNTENGTPPASVWDEDVWEGSMVRNDSSTSSEIGNPDVAVDVKYANGVALNDYELWSGDDALPTEGEVGDAPAFVAGDGSEGSALADDS